MRQFRETLHKPLHLIMHPLSRIQLRHRPSRVYAARIRMLPLIKPPREYHRLAVLMIDLDWS